MELISASFCIVSERRSDDASLPSGLFTDPCGEKVVPSTVNSLGIPAASTTRNCRAMNIIP